MSEHQQAISVAKAIHHVLKNNLHVQSFLGDPARLYELAPEDPIYPYLTYGPMRSESANGDEVPLMRHSVSLHLWSRYGGRAEIMTGLSILATALENTSMDLEGAHLIGIHSVYSDYFRAPDGRTMHGILRLNITTQPELAAAI